MGRVTCIKHGASGISLVCFHISEAFFKNIRVDLNTITDEFWGTHWLCTDCLKFYKKNTQTEEFINEFLSIFKPICCKCFNEWKDSLNISTLESHDVDIDSL